MRILVLWKQLSSYTAACFSALAQTGVTLRVVHRAATPNAPFEDEELTRGYDSWSWDGTVDDSTIERELDAFRPDVVLVCSWDVGAYRRAVRPWAGRALRVLCMDNPWLGTIKQWGGRTTSPVLIRRSYDIAFLPDERQRAFANRLGFSDRHVLWGLYACDEQFFSAEPPSGFGFLTVGRLVPEKGVSTLAAAYATYRRQSTDPWPLRVAGTGPLAAQLSGIEGVDLLGFVQPDDLPNVYRDAGCFVLASDFEPWGVVIQEAAASGLPVICTTACGASTRLVLDGYNGRVVEAGDVAGLAQAMAWVASREVAAWTIMSRAGQELARQFTPQRWAEYLLDRCHDLTPSIVRR